MTRPLLNVPMPELDRTPIGRRVAALAVASGLFLHHREHRVSLPFPEHWLPDDRPDLGTPPQWQAGVLPDSRERPPRLESMVGGFHPAHRSVSTVHELVHRLVGFGWRPHATPLFLTLAARLSEVLPTALTHFFDDLWLRRCEAHAGMAGAMGAMGPVCAACEHAAARGELPDGLDPRLDDLRGRALETGLRFMDQELAAIARSRRTGRCEPVGCGFLNPAGEALVYAAAHLERLHSPEMAEFIVGFFAPDQGCHGTLDALEARVLAARAALLDGAPLAKWDGDAARWAVQDVAWRLLNVRAQCDADEGAHAGLTAIVDGLADGGSPAAAYAAYVALHTDFVMPEPADVFAVGYDLEGCPGRSVRHVTNGLESVLPGTLALLSADASADEGVEAEVAAFLASDAAARSPLARRFAAWLRTTRPGPVADMATYEAAVAHPLPTDMEAATLGVGGARDKRRRRSPSFEVLRFGCDVLALAQALDELPPDEGQEPDGELVNRPICLAIGRPAHGELVITDITRATADALLNMDEAVEPASVGLSKGEAAALEAVGVLVPSAWKVE